MDKIDVNLDSAVKDSGDAAKDMVEAKEISSSNSKYYIIGGIIGILVVAGLVLFFVLKD